MQPSEPLSIFLSAGTAYTQAQEEFISAVEAHLKSHKCAPQTVGRSKYSVRQPVQAARDLIGDCHGAVVIAFERTRVVTGLEKPGSEHQLEIRDESHPTVWNQMESAMAYAQRLPILTLIQTGLKRQGMLSDRFEWTAIEADLSPDLLRSEQFQQVFSEWLSLAQEASVQPTKPGLDPSEIRVGALLSQLDVKQGWSLLVVVAGVLAALAGSAFKLGQAFPSEAKPVLNAAPASESKPASSAVRP